LVNAVGQAVFSGERQFSAGAVQNLDIDCSSLASGMYVLQMNTADGKHGKSFKLIKTDF